MAVNIQIDKLKIKTVIPLEIRVLAWLVIFIAFTIILFGNSIKEIQFVLSTGWIFSNKGIYSCAALLLTLIFLFISRDKLLKDVYYFEQKHWLYALLEKITSIDLIIFSVLVLLAYPIPQMAELTLVRVYILGLAVFIIIFGRKNTTIPFLLIIPNVLGALIPFLPYL